MRHLNTHEIIAMSNGLHIPYMQIFTKVYNRIMEGNRYISVDASHLNTHTLHDVCAVLRTNKFKVLLDNKQLLITW